MTGPGEPGRPGPGFNLVPWAAAILVLFALALPAFAHPAVSAVAIVKIEPGGRVTVTLSHDALAFALNEQPARIADAPMFALLTGPREDLAAALADAKERLADALRLTADGQPLPFQITEAPTPETIDAWKRENPIPRLPVKLDFVALAQLPPSAQSISIQLPVSLADVILLLDRPDTEPLTLPLAPGEQSPDFPPFPAAPFAHPTSDIPHPTSTPTPGVGLRFARLGFTHIIPGGPDHCLLVLGLFLLVPRPRTVLCQVTAFTVAHTITLTLTALHLIGLPASLVEPAIAASVAFIGIENLLAARRRAVSAFPRVTPLRVAVAFLFGLVHGMGVATSFQEAGFPQGQIVPALAAFTVGVEAGHITVLAAAFALLGWTRSRAWYRQAVSTPLSLAIAAIALVWLIQRLHSAVG